MLDGTSSSSHDNHRFWRSVAALLILALTGWHIIYLGWLCPLDLVPDEAHYWDWSRNLDWSYYSKGPLVAWLIRLSLELFGPLSLSLTGSEMMAVRLPAVMCGSLTLAALYILAVQTVRSDRFAFVLVLLAAITPLISAASILMTIDSPFIACWSLALVTGYRAFTRGLQSDWALTGLFVGLGILAKYTMALWLLSFGMFLLFTPEFRQLLFRRGFWLMAGVAICCSAPIVFWNATHGWVTIRHVAGQAGVPMDNRSTGLRPFGPVEFLGTQFVLLLGWGFVAWLGGILTYRPNRSVDSGIRYLWWMSLPTIMVFGISSLRTSGQPNWPVAAYVSGAVLGLLWVHKELQSPVAWKRRLMKVSVGLACTVSLLVTVACHDTRLFWPLMEGVAKKIKGDDPYAIRRVDPSCRLRGWSTLGREIDGIRQDVVRRDGVDPTLAGYNWNIPGEVGFYCEGHPKVYSLGPFAGDRFNQYDLWHPNPVADRSDFTGQTFVVVNGVEEGLKQLFDEAKLAKHVVYSDGGVPIAAWTIWVCRGYRGMDVGSRVDTKRY